jgi:hypothetical protein
MTTDRTFISDLEKNLEATFSTEQLSALRPLLKEAETSGAVHTARGIKEQLAKVLDGAQRGTPQLIKRSTDELPALVISLGYIVDMIKPERVLNAWEELHGKVSSPYPIANLEPLPRGKSGYLDISAEHLNKR